jgi:hypothetical protein
MVIANAAKMMLTRALYEGFRVESLQSSTDTSLLGTAKWCAAFIDASKHIRLWERVVYMLFIVLATILLIGTPIILSLWGGAGEWVQGAQKLGYGKDIYATYEATTTLLDETRPSDPTNPYDELFKFGARMNTAMLASDGSSGTLLPKSQVWSGGLALVQTDDGITGKGQDTTDTLIPAGLGVVATVGCSKTDMTRLRMLTPEQTTQFVGKFTAEELRRNNLLNRTCLSSTIERVDSAKDSVTIRGWNMKDMHIPFTMAVVASDHNSTSCWYHSIACGLNVMRTQSNLIFRDGRLVNWTPQSLDASNSRDKEAAELVFRLLRAGTFLSTTFNASTAVYFSNRLHVLDTRVGFSFLENIPSYYEIRATKMEDVLERFLRAAMIPIALGSMNFDLTNRTADTWETGKQAVDRWLTKHNMETTRTVVLDLAMYTGRPYALVGLVMSCLIVLVGLLAMGHAVWWYHACGPMHRLIWHRLGNFSRLLEAIGGTKVGQHVEGSAKREPLVPNATVVRFRKVGDHLELTQE